MNEQFKGKYKIESIRLKDWDYSGDGYYFVTICSKDRENFFGEIVNDEMQLSEIGKIVENELIKTEKIRKNVKLDEFIIMPNHIHEVIIIDHQNQSETCSSTVETHCNASLQRNQNINQPYQNKFGPQINNLSSIIRGFKSTTTKQIHLIDSNFSWQARFYDRIIRNKKELFNVRQYIQNNPLKWNEDRNNLKNK